MNKIKVSFITTVYNEENSIESFLNSLLRQTKKPDEIIIVDGGSQDKTLNIIKYFKQVKSYVKKGNRSIGRNYAIKKAKGKIILCSDAGCILDKNWVKNITSPFQDSNVDVVAGYYKGVSKTTFQKCLIPYVLVMPGKVNKEDFLPASRSMAFTKNIWKQVGGFPEMFSHNEDYVFANKLKKIKAKIIFQKKAIVYWVPRKNLAEAFVMFFRFAFGDVQSGIFRKKVFLIFLRYLIGFLVLLFYFKLKQPLLLILLVMLVISYCCWAVLKNKRYSDDWGSFFIFPLIQLTSDIAVMFGSLLGLMRLLC